MPLPRLFRSPPPTRRPGRIVRSGQFALGALALAWFAGALAAAAPAVPTKKAPPLPPGVVVHRDLAYVAAGHPRQKLDLYLPAPTGGPETARPVLLWIHGGGWRAGSKDGCPPARQGFLGRGFAVASLGYRLSSDAIFPAQIEDVKSAVRWLRAHAAEYGLDPRRFAAWGSSAGGHLVALLGTSGEVSAFDRGAHLEQSSRVQAVVDFYGPADFVRFLATPGYETHRQANSPENLLVGAPLAQHPELAARVSPVTYATPDDPPFFIVHGDADPTVPVSQSEALHAALRKVRVDSTLVILPGARHGGPEFAQPDLLGRIEAFLRRSLR